jgi:Tfp pilus assembly protein PilF
LILRPRLLAIPIVLVFAAAAWAATPGADQLASAHLVEEAEQMITDAGHNDPLDTVKVRAAIVKLKQAVKHDPRNDGAYVDLGFSYALLKDAPTAVDMYREATRINPSAANFKELADIYMRVGSPEEALMAANAGLSKDSRNAGLYNARGMSLMDLKRFDEAARDFRKALELDPSLAAAKENLDALGPGYSARETIGKKKQQPAQ